MISTAREPSPMNTVSTYFFFFFLTNNVNVDEAVLLGVL